MSESIDERLSRFTPHGGELNRDALLFAAGRASARPNRGWMSLAAILAGTQVLLLVFIWPRAAPPVGSSTPVASAPDRPSGFETPASGPLASSGLWSARHHPHASEIEDHPSADITLIDSGPPLRAAGASRPALVN